MKISETQHVGLLDVDNKLHFRTFNPNDLKTFDHVPGIFYRLNYLESPMSGTVSWWLDKGDKFASVPKNIYGRVDKLTESIISDFKRRTVPTGALFHGEKGNGKTIQINHICNKLVVEDVPIVIVDQFIPPTILRDSIELLSKVNAKLCVVFDEFEKYYHDEKDQNQILGLFSNRDLKQTLFLMAVNNYDRLSEFYKDRPSRLLFSIPYNDIDLDVADKIIRDHVKHKDIARLITNHVHFAKPNYDQIFEIINNTKECDSLENFIDKVNDLNVADFTRTVCFIKEVIKITPPTDREDYKEVNVSNAVEFDITEDNKAFTITFGDTSPDVVVIKDPFGFIDCSVDYGRKLKLRVNNTTFESNGNYYLITLELIVAVQFRNAKTEIIDRCKKACYVGNTVNETMGKFTRADLEALRKRSGTLTTSTSVADDEDSDTDVNKD